MTVSDWANVVVAVVAVTTPAVIALRNFTVINVKLDDIKDDLQKQESKYKEDKAEIQREIGFLKVSYEALEKRVYAQELLGKYEVGLREHQSHGEAHEH